MRLDKLAFLFDPMSVEKTMACIISTDVCQGEGIIVSRDKLNSVNIVQAPIIVERNIKLFATVRPGIK